MEETSKNGMTMGIFFKFLIYFVFAGLMLLMGTISEDLWPTRIGFYLATLLFVYAIYVTYRQISGDEKYVLKNIKNDHLYKGILFLLLAGVSYFVIILAIALPLLFIPPVFALLGTGYLFVFLKESGHKRIGVIILIFLGLIVLL